MDKQEPINIKILFDAVPIEFVSDKSGFYQKSTKKNLYYIITGYQNVLTNEYFVSYYILQKNKGNSINSIKIKFSETKVFNCRLRVMTFIYNFLEKFSIHGRIVNSMKSNSKIINEELFFEETTDWVKKILYAIRDSEI